MSSTRMLSPATLALLGAMVVLPIQSAARAQESSVTELSFPSSGVVFRLTPEATYQDGCIDSPCDCAVRNAERLVGTMRVHAPEFFGTVVRFPITDVRWWATFAPDEEVMITGHGEFNSIAGFAGCIRELKLNLSIGGADPIVVTGLFNVEQCRLDLRHFPIQGDIDECQGVGILVDAVPVLPKVRCFVLGDQSFFAEGCFGNLCACPIFAAPLAGRFALVELGDWDTMKHFAVVRARFRAGFEGEDPLRVYAGFGRYRRALSTQGPVQQMRLWLVEDGATEVDFDSGVVPVDPEAEGISIDLLDLPPGSCFNTQLRIRARRCPICPDVTGDLLVNFTDIVSVLGNWGETYAEELGPGDADEDGIVTFADINMILGHWLERCEQ